MQMHAARARVCLSPLLSFRHALRLVHGQKVLEPPGEV